MPASPKFLSKKALLWVLTSITLLIAFAFGTFFIGKRFAGEILNEVVKRETNGYYGLTFSSIDFDLLDRRFKVNELSLNIDTTQDFHSLNIRNAYEVSLRELVVDLESLTEFYFNKELLMKSVQVIDPDIQMVPLGRRTKDQTFSFQAGNMYQAISDYLKVLRIDYFRIQEGTLAYGSNTFSLGNIDFLVKNLLMDSVSRSNNVFYSETIKLEVRNQKFHLPDSIHEVTFDRFLLSTEDSLLSFENFRVKPVAGLGVAFEGDNDLNVYDIHVPRLSFKGIDYISAYQDNHLVIEELILEQPAVFVDDETHAQVSDKEKDNSLLSLLFQVFGAIDIGQLKVRKAHLDIITNSDGKNQRFKVEESDIVFHNIHLDTANFRFHSRNKYFDDIELDIHNYTYLLPDSVHTVRFDRLSVNSFDSEIRLDSVSVTHERAGNEAKLLVEVEMPQLHLKGIDYQRAIAEGVLPMGKLEIADVQVSIRNTGRTKESEPINLKNMYQKIRPIFREVALDEVAIKNVRLRLPKGIYFGDIDLNFKGVKFNSVSDVFSGLYQQADLRIADFVYDRDSIKISGARLHSDHSLATYHLVDWNIDVNTETANVKGSFDTLFLTGMKVDSLVAGNYKTFTRAILSNPVFDFEISTNPDAGKRSGISGMGIEKELILSKGKFNGKLNDTRLSVAEVNADVFVGDSTAFRKLSAKELTIDAPAHNHAFKVGVWSFDTLDGHMYFKDLRIEPINLADTSILAVSAHVPLLSLMDFEQAEFFDNNHLYASDLYVESPDVSLLSVPLNTGSDTLSERGAFSTAVKQFRIADGRFLAQDLGKSWDSLLIGGVSMDIQGLKFPRENPFEGDAVFYSNSIVLEISEVLPYLSTSDTMSFRNVQFKSQGGIFTVDSIQYAKVDGSLSGLVPSLRMSGLDVEKLYQREGFWVDTVVIEGLSGRNLLAQDDPAGTPFAKPVSVSHFALTGMNWVFDDTLRETQYAFNNVELESDFIKVTDTFQLQNVGSYVQKLSLRGGPFEVPISSEYEIAVEKYEAQYPGTSLSLQGVDLHPTVSKEAYSASLSTQNDWFDVAVDEILLTKADIIRAVTEQNYVIEKVSLHGLDALIYRDKSVPFPADQVRNLPQADLRSLPLDFRIDTLWIKGRVRYQEKPVSNEEYGEISFDQLDGQLVNLKNMEIRPEDIMTLSATGKLMQAGSFEVTSSYLLDHPNNRFSFRGSVRDFPLDSMNRMLGPVGNINIKSGFSDELLFNFGANDSLARGEMRFRYDDLKIQILNKQTHDTHGLGQGIKTFFANTFVVKNKNPSFLVFVRKGVIFQERDTSRAVFNYWGKALLSGAVSSIGIHKSDKAARRFEKEVDE